MWDQFPPNKDNRGADFSAGGNVTVNAPIHHVLSTAVITTITKGLGLPDDFLGPVYLISDSVFSWTTSGNIGGVSGTTLIAGSAYAFLYDKTTGKWYPVSVKY